MVFGIGKKGSEADATSKVTTAKGSTDDRSEKERRSVDDMHKAEISSLKEEIEKYKREKFEMKRYIDQIDHKLSVTLAEKLRIQNQGNLLQKFNNHLLSEGERVQRESASLREVIALRDEHISILENEKDGLQDAIMALRADSQREQLKQKGEIDFLRADNERLRTNIFKNESDLNPLRSEEYYIQLLEGLKGDVEGWIASHAQRTPTQMLSISNEVIVLDILMSLGRAGENSGNFLIKNKSLQKEYCDVRTRITLIRHFVCLFLFDQILNPLAPGLPASISDSLAWMEEDMISQEQELRKIIRIHQALCRAARRYVDCHNAEYQMRLTVTLEKWLAVLLPASHESEIQKAVAKFTTKALTLKLAMMEETAVYRCHWAYSGERFDKETMEAESGERGPVYLCTSPGLRRISEETGGNINSVKAGVILKRLEEK